MVAEFVVDAKNHAVAMTDGTSITRRHLARGDKIFAIAALKDRCYDEARKIVIRSPTINSEQFLHPEPPPAAY